MWEDILGSLVGLQGWINAAVAAELRAFAASRDVWTLALVLPLGAAFGAVHALTPGHSKALLASYVAGSGLTLLRAVGVALALSLTHIMTAVLIAALALPLVTTTIVGVGRAPQLELLSRALLAAVGVWMLVRAARGYRHAGHAGALVGVFAGLVPCPLTLFTMVYASARGIPEAGLAFAAAMMVGVAFTLALVALAAALARDRLQRVLASHGGSLDRAARVIEAVGGLLLIALSVVALAPR